MKVHIEDDLYITSDERQFCLSQLRKSMDKEGNEKEYFVHLGFYSSLGGLINDFIKRKIKETPSTTLCELLQEVRNIEAYVKSKVQI
ncbi:DUF5405 family protein [Paenibacillus larvae]|uniref:DUF5405 family protein n=1 Tax=Paenibacillus larvae TaxID=1464 RepID=A0AAP5JSD3_9BACL|nr:DUF5405 family protein [Paenibacillus larvae]ETK29807.1 hypothetical protein ERIC1_1c33660 [Paenibacillus larvae subsp. larvae DSM 25719]MCY9688885.1 DUF5405 family protein [Paenibacillus larvae]MCY9710034.1 DUF5405 family protein [Paenibacillus larvae]MCY9718942.1 DUF5405 family protein [Paenibacillus larvae]MDT2173459.1 DUF5405 family protein [Paenibacillus larvae]